MTRLPDFIIIGAMKCATSTLHEQLARQPGVFMSTPKEPRFFSDDHIYERGMDWYAGLFAGAPDGAVCGESSTHYTKLPAHPHSVDRIARHLPNAQFIYIMRHPIDRLVSQYVHEWSMRNVSGPIDQAVDAFPPLVEYGRYAMQMRPYLERFGLERVLPVVFERLTANPQRELERVASFIGVTWPVTWDESLGRRNAGLERMRRSPLRDAILDLPGLKQARRLLLPESLRSRLKQRWMMREKPRLSTDVWTRLERLYDEDLRQLGQWLGRPLTCATWKEAVLGEPLEWAMRSAPREKVMA